MEVQKKIKYYQKVLDFFALIGAMIPMFLLGAFISSNSNHKEAWGYVFSHNLYSLFFVVIFVLVSFSIVYFLSKKIKTLEVKNDKS